MKHFTIASILTLFILTAAYSLQTGMEGVIRWQRCSAATGCGWLNNSMGIDDEFQSDNDQNTAGDEKSVKKRHIMSRSQLSDSSYREFWEFEAWSDKTRDNRRYLIVAMDITTLLSDEFQCSTSVDFSDEMKCKTFTIACRRFHNDRETEEFWFRTYLYPDVFMARNHMMDILSLSVAPMEYSKNYYASQEITYGDVSFGRNLWGIGNSVFRTGNQQFDSLYVEETFKRIDSMLMVFPQMTTGLPSAIRLTLTQTAENRWKIACVDSVGNRTIIVSSRDSLEMTDDHSHIMLSGDETNPEHVINVIVFNDVSTITNTRIVVGNSPVFQPFPQTGNAFPPVSSFHFLTNHLVTWRPFYGTVRFTIFDYAGRLLRIVDGEGRRGAVSLQWENGQSCKLAIVQIEIRNHAGSRKETRRVISIR